MTTILISLAVLAVLLVAESVVLFRVRAAVRRAQAQAERAMQVGLSAHVRLDLHNGLDPQPGGRQPLRSVGGAS